MKTRHTVGFGLIMLLVAAFLFRLIPSDVAAKYYLASAAVFIGQLIFTIINGMMVLLGSFVISMTFRAVVVEFLDETILPGEKLEGSKHLFFAIPLSIVLGVLWVLIVPPLARWTWTWMPLFNDGNFGAGVLWWGVWATASSLFGYWAGSEAIANSDY